MMRQEDMLRQRLPILTGAMIFAGVVLILRVIWFQFPQDPRVAAEFAIQRDANSGRTENIESPRGEIYDRNGNPLAVNTVQYGVWISPTLISDVADTAPKLARILSNWDELELFTLLRDSTNAAEFLGVVDGEAWRQIRDLGLNFAIRSDRIQRRVYPQGSLGAQVIGFVSGVGEDATGNYGIEGYYETQLAGSFESAEVSNIPFDLPEDFTAQLESGANLVLTLDRDVQFLAESELQRAITETGATGGTIIIMDPRTGDILGMASYPSFDPNTYYEVDNPLHLQNPAISGLYEPGSIFKVLTVAAALELGVVTPDWTYNDQGAFDVGGYRIQNWDRRAHGEVDVEQILVQSLNVGAAILAVDELQWDFYQMMARFGIGRTTRIDLAGEISGVMRTPNQSATWSESDLATNSFGQGLSVTPLQMLTAINAIANDGIMMKPRVVYQMIDGDNIITSEPQATRVISADTAEIVTNMMISVIQGDVDGRAQVPGYTIAGKTGTAEIPSGGGYETDAWIMSFVGFLPADNPQVSVLIKLDRPTSGRWASEVAAPVFSRLVSRLVVLLEIPADDVRIGLQSAGASVGN